MALAVFATLFLLSLAAFFYARRGRKIDDHPLCRKCGFDLTGRPVESDRCPECGQLLSSKTICIGHRQPRRSLAASAIWLLLISLIGGGIAAYQHDIVWYHYAPTWYLLYRAGSPNSNARTPAIKELLYRNGRLNHGNRAAIFELAIAYQNDPTKPWESSFYDLVVRQDLSEAQWHRYVDSLISQATLRTGDRRYEPAILLAKVLDGGDVTDQQMGKLIDALLAYHGDTFTPWDYHVGERIEVYRKAGVVTDAQWKLYASQAWSGAFHFRVRDKVRSGDPFPLEYTLQQSARVARNSVLRAVLSPTHLYFQPGKRQPAQCPLNFSAELGRNVEGTCLQLLTLPEGLIPGQQAAQLDSAVQVFDSSDHSKLVATDAFNLPLSFELLPVDQPSVRIIHDPSLTEKVRQSIHWKSLLAPQNDNGWTSSEATMLLIENPPVDLSFEVFAINSAGKKIRIGTITQSAGQGKFYKIFPLPVGENFGVSADVIFQGGPAAAVETIDAYSGWDGQIIIKDVPITIEVVGKPSGYH